MDGVIAGSKAAGKPWVICNSVEGVVETFALEERRSVASSVVRLLAWERTKEESRRL